MNANTPQDLAQLQQQLGEDNANAIAVFVDGRIAAALDANKAELKQLGDRVRTMHTEHGATEEVKEAAQVVSDATKGNQAAIDSIDVTQYPSEEEVVKTDTDRVKEAREVVDKAEKTLEGRVTSLETDVAQIKRDVSGLKASVEGATTAASQASRVASRAMAVAIAATGGGSRRANAIKVFLGALVASAIIYGLLAASRDNLDWNWFDQVAWPIGLAAAVSYIAYLFLPTTEDRMASQAYANAQASAGDDGDHHQGLAGVLPWRRAHGHAQADGDQSAHSGAQANVSHGHAHSGANASAH